MRRDVVRSSGEREGVLAASVIQPAQATGMPVLVVDLDGTLLKTDMMVETFFARLSTDPIRAMVDLAALRHGKPAFKAALADHTPVDLAALPFNQACLDFIRAERAKGRAIYLASGSNKVLVAAIADTLGLFDGVFASDDRVNLTGACKAACLVAQFGVGGFDYAGNEAVDFAVWEQAASVIVVNAVPDLVKKVVARWPNARLIDCAPLSPRVMLTAIRAHQWLKNLLLFVPAFLAHRFDLGPWLITILGFISFSLCASSVYVLNDLIDLNRDRHHLTKRFRPFASGALSPLFGVTLFPVLLGAAIGTSLLLPMAFIEVLGVYYVTTLAYSLRLKRELVLDVVVLAGLYGLRLVAGGVAVDARPSAWFAAFSIFFFVALALVKRITELVGRLNRGQGDPVGRAYRLNDVPVLEALAASSAFTAVLVFALYLNSADVSGLYRAPHRLWLICLVLIYWLSRALILTRRGEMPDDPIVFAATDRASQICALVVAVIVLIAL